MREHSLREALVEAVIGSPASLPSPLEQDRTAFWADFDRNAPIHLRVGFRAAALALGVALPLRLGYRRPFHKLAPDQRQAVLAHAADSLVLAPVMEVAKVVSCFAYFDDDEVQDAVRSPGGVA